MWEYLLGVFIAFVFGATILSYTKDEKCNASKDRCMVVAALFSLLSWFMVLFYLIIVIQITIKKYKSHKGY